MPRKYDPTKDEILWQSSAIVFKPKATLQAQIKRYMGGNPKLILVEEGEGYGNKLYSGYLLKRVDLENLDLVIELLQEGKKVLQEILNKEITHE